jgi:hypothetical protein
MKIQGILWLFWCILSNDSNGRLESINQYSVFWVDCCRPRVPSHVGCLDLCVWLSLSLLILISGPFFVGLKVLERGLEGGVGKFWLDTFIQGLSDLWTWQVLRTAFKWSLKGSPVGSPAAFPWLQAWPHLTASEPLQLHTTDVTLRAFSMQAL